MTATHWILTLICQDKPGIVHAISGAIVEASGNITESQQFSSDDTLCMVVSDEAFVMLLNEKRFADFTKQPIVDATKATEVLYCLSCESRAEVEQMVKTAIENGGRAAMPAQDHGFMFGWSFYDPDGHHWEVMWMDPAAVQPQP